MNTQKCLANSHICSLQSWTSAELCFSDTVFRPDLASQNLLRRQKKAKVQSDLILLMLESSGENVLSCDLERIQPSALS